MFSVNQPLDPTPIKKEELAWLITSQWPVKVYIHQRQLYKRTTYLELQGVTQSYHKTIPDQSHKGFWYTWSIFSLFSWFFIHYVDLHDQFGVTCLIFHNWSEICYTYTMLSPDSNVISLASKLESALSLDKNCNSAYNMQKHKH